MPRRPDDAAPPETRVIYRSLLLRGLAPAEAANVVAFLAGLRSPRIRWTLQQVEAVVALRDRWATAAHPDDRPAPSLTWSRS